MALGSCIRSGGMTPFSGSCSGGIGPARRGVAAAAAASAGAGGAAAAPPGASRFVAADRPPARPGDYLSRVDTPALVVDLDGALLASAAALPLAQALGGVQQRARLLASKRHPPASIHTPHLNPSSPPSSNPPSPSHAPHCAVFEANCGRLKAAMAAFPGVSVRPHAKAHKCPELAALQLRLLGPGLAPGVCTQKVSEAEALVAGGVTDVLVSNQVVAPAKLARLAALAAGHPGARLSVCVDDAAALRAAARAAAAAGARLGVLVEVNAGQDRCGVDAPSEAARLAELAAELELRAFGRVAGDSGSGGGGSSSSSSSAGGNSSSGGKGGVVFQGIQAYHGGLQHVRDPAERAAAVAAVAARAAAAVDAIKGGAGLRCAVVTGGGSGTYRLEAASGVFTEVRGGHTLNSLCVVVCCRLTWMCCVLLAVTCSLTFSASFLAPT